jgi:hypothetical protein
MTHRFPIARLVRSRRRRFRVGGDTIPPTVIFTFGGR